MAIAQLLRDELAGVMLDQQAMRCLDVGAGTTQRIEVACARRQRSLCGGMKADAVLEMPAQSVDAGA